MSSLYWARVQSGPTGRLWDLVENDHLRNLAGGDDLLPEFTESSPVRLVAEIPGGSLARSARPLLDGTRVSISR